MEITDKIRLDYILIEAHYTPVRGARGYSTVYWEGKPYIHVIDRNIRKKIREQKRRRRNSKPSEDI